MNHESLDPLSQQDNFQYVVSFPLLFKEKKQADLFFRARTNTLELNKIGSRLQFIIIAGL